MKELTLLQTKATDGLVCDGVKQRAFGAAPAAAGGVDGHGAGVSVAPLSHMCDIAPQGVISNPGTCIRTYQIIVCKCSCHSW